MVRTFIGSSLRNRWVEGTLILVVLESFGRPLNGTWRISTPRSAPAVQLPGRDDRLDELLIAQCLTGTSFCLWSKLTAVYS